MFRLNNFLYVFLFPYSYSYINLQIHENPCPKIFRYYRKSVSGEIYGEAILPYGGQNILEFTINATYGIYLRGVSLKIQLATPIDEIKSRSTVKYYILFPIRNVVPRITKITYNGKVYCSAPSEPLTSGITNVWFSRVDTVFNSRSSVTNPLRIPENPCPNTFRYYKKSDTGNVYGEAVVPFDQSNHLEFAVNASLVGYFNKADLKIQLATPPQKNVEQPMIKYNIFFPFTHVIPKITQISYNGRVYCSGPPEPLVPGSQGVTNVWATHIYSFNNVVNTEKQVTDNVIGSTDQNTISDVNLPIRDPNSDAGSNNISRSSFSDNPFFNSEIDSGFIDVSKSSNDEKCGIANNLIVPLIIGGAETQEGQYPWLVALFSYNSDKNTYEYRCAANLISNRHVVTAARCIQYYNIQVVKTEDILLVLGKNDLTHWATNGAVTRSASKVQCHPYFKENSKSAHGDIAVITLNKPVQISKTIRPVCLWDEDEELDSVVGKQGSLAAWGADEKSKPDQLTVLKANHVEIPIASQFDCLKSDEIFRNLTSEMTFCAGAKNGKGPCVGDSGAGFVIPKDRVFYLRGIASIAPSSKDGLCDLSKYIIFCDVAKFGKWIKSCMQN